MATVRPYTTLIKALNEGEKMEFELGLDTPSGVLVLPVKLPAHLPNEFVKKMVVYSLKRRSTGRPCTLRVP